MNEPQYTHIILQGSHAISYYHEQEVVQFCQLDMQIIDQLHEAGLIKGIDIPGEERRYSERDVALLRRVRRLSQDLGVNVEGVEIILRLQLRLEEQQRELEQYKEQIDQ